MLSMVASTPRSRTPAISNDEADLEGEQILATNDDVADFEGEGHSQFTTLEDNVMMKQILTTHDNHNFHKDLHVSSLMESLDEKSQKVDFVGMLEALACTIHKISCEISSKCSKGESGGGDAHSITVALFKSLSKFSWDAKVLVALTAFTITYGEFWLVEELYLTHPLAMSIALLKQLPNIFEQSEKLRPIFKELWRLIKAMFNVTKCIIQFHELPPQYISPDQPPMLVATTFIPTAVYWTIRSVVTCTSQIIGLIGLDHKSIPLTTEASEMSSLAQKVNNIHENLTKQLGLCNQHITEKKQVEHYNTLVELFETTHVDNMKILKPLIDNEDDSQPFLQQSMGKRVGVEILRGVYVSLLISDLNISQEEVVILKELTRVVLWLPVVDRSLPWTKARQRDFDRVQSNISGEWYSIHPSLIHPAVIKYAKEIWHFNKKPILVSLDSEGRVHNPNCFHTVWIWGWWGRTLPEEERLWRTEAWRLQILVETGFDHLGRDENLLDWIRGEQFICLYGGENIDWIRDFTTTTREVAQAIGIPFQMMYMGKRNPNKEQVRKNIDIITIEKLSYCWKDLTLIWYFWIRLESMLYFTMQLGNTIDNDPIMKGIMKLLIFDASEHGWALISKGSEIMAIAKGDIILTCFKEYNDRWKENAKIKGFILALIDHLEQLHTPHHCNCLILPETEDRMIPKILVCTECGCPMEKSVSLTAMYSCCND
ncbi:protein SIEVE ELEMENT OCCLUSION B-like isoform X2 [Macadamia integrifolia]|uniref:protein SIEVE ELEMENT OCCLUSION B-like isoform X2 n=1 Tax=Macadamia integrifolia TaxID=60698 RepID=UPI001C4E6344|nr:protein SIEVE ELEMENT OCCLUSION B-like isoform X2 [Macadamia integrifolia]